MGRGAREKGTSRNGRDPHDRRCWSGRRRQAPAKRRVGGDRGRPRAAAKAWVPATSGNFSARIDENTIAITRSGTDKGALSRADILVVDLDAPDPRASAEAPLHYALYRSLPSVNAILHITTAPRQACCRAL